MNINQYFSQVKITEKLWANPIPELLRMRGKTFHRFCQVELVKGGIDPQFSLSTSQGQNNARQLFARMIEEIFESFEAEGHDHALEELIDALNFGWGIMFLGEWIEDGKNREKITDELTRIYLEMGNLKVEYETMADQLFYLGGLFSPFLALLRARTWQTTDQHHHFMGSTELGVAMCALFEIVLSNFADRTEFLNYFIAKDMVLNFRIDTQY